MTVAFDMFLLQECVHSNRSSSRETLTSDCRQNRNSRGSVWHLLSLLPVPAESSKQNCLRAAESAVYGRQDCSARLKQSLVTDISPLLLRTRPAVPIVNCGSINQKQALKGKQCLFPSLAILHMLITAADKHEVTKHLLTKSASTTVNTHSQICLDVASSSDLSRYQIYN